MSSIVDTADFMKELILCNQDTAVAGIFEDQDPSEEVLDSSPSELLTYFEENGIRTMEDMEAAMATWNIVVKKSGLLCKLCHTDKTDHSSPIYWFSNGTILTMVNSEFKIVAYSFRRMTDLDDEFNDYEGKDPMRIRTELIPKLAENPGKRLYLITLLEGVEMKICRSNTGKLLISTRRNIHAKDSKFGPRGSRDHQTLLMEAFGPFRDLILSQIQPGFTYTFLLTHPEVSRVVMYRWPKAYIVGIRDMKRNKELSPMLEGVDHLPAIVVNSETYQEHVEVLNDPSSPAFRRDIVGYVLRDDEFNYQKFTSPLYKKMSKVYGNTPQGDIQLLMYRYFELRRNPEEHREYLTFFPHMADAFHNFEENLLNIAKETHKIYWQMYIQPSIDAKKGKKTERVTVPVFLKKTLYDLHQNYQKEVAKAREEAAKAKEEGNTTPVVMPVTTVEVILHHISAYDVPLLCNIYKNMILGGSVPTRAAPGAAAAAGAGGNNA